MRVVCLANLATRDINQQKVEAQPNKPAENTSFDETCIKFATVT